jgi:hypothetical protein
VTIALEAQARLLQEAQALITAGEHGVAAQTLTRLLSTYPDSPRSGQARWLLARCYEALGRSYAAIAQYELLAKIPGAPYAEEAARRLGELHAPDHNTGRSGGPNGLWVPATAIPREAGLESWLKNLAASGVTMVILEGAMGKGVTFQTMLAPVTQDMFQRLVPAAHRHHILVFGAVALDRMDWLSSDLGWHDARYDSRRRQIEVSPYLDLFNPAVQEYLTGLLTDLAQTEVDGILMRTVAGSNGETFSRFAVQEFQREFQTPLEPAKLFARGLDGRAPGGQARAAVEPTPEFWRWVGWKARMRIKLVEKLMQGLRRMSPGLQVAIELHQESITEPIKALVDYGEDVLEAKRNSADYFVLRVLHGGREGSGPVLQRTRELLGSLDRVWIIRRPASPEDRLQVTLKKDRLALPPEVGLIYDALPGLGTLP